jgi:hypothetical protein
MIQRNTFAPNGEEYRAVNRRRGALPRATSGEYTPNLTGIGKLEVRVNLSTEASINECTPLPADSHGIVIHLVDAASNEGFRLVGPYGDICNNKSNRRDGGVIGAGPGVTMNLPSDRADARDAAMLMTPGVGVGYNLSPLEQQCPR